MGLINGLFIAAKQTTVIDRKILLAFGATLV